VCSDSQLAARFARGLFAALGMNIMNPSMERFYRFLSTNGVQPDNLPSFVGHAVFAFITEENVVDIIKLLAKSQGTANLTFWKKVNSLPTTDEEWAACWVIGGEITDAAAKSIKNNDRRVVELVRSTVTSMQMSVNSHFGKVNA